MIHNNRFTFLCAALLVVTGVNEAQTPSEYDTQVQEGKTQLQAGHADLALTVGDAAIKMNADRWEAYALAGGALMNLKRFEEAADRLSEAIKRSPEAAQETLRDLRRQCLRAESGSSQISKEAIPAATTQAEVVLWKSIENSSNPTDFQSYLDQYPKGVFVALAERRLAESKIEEQKHIEERNKLEQDSVWTDPSTGLMWTRRDNGTDISWSRAVEFCSQLRLLGGSNWRIPTYSEVAKIHVGGLRKHLTSDFHLADGAGSLWTSTPAGGGSYFSGKLSQSGYVVFPEPTKGDGMRTLCVRGLK